jgi:hypothetical protein
MNLWYTKVRTEDGDVTLETSLLWIDKSLCFVVYYETIKREVKVKPICECRWNIFVYYFVVVYYESMKRKLI